MVFSSTVFLFLFLPLLLISYYLPLFKSRKWKNGVLLLFSVGFYAWGEPLFVWAMLGAIAVNWIVALAMDRSLRFRKAWLIFGIVFDALLLGAFKYLSFFSKNLAFLTGNDRLIVEIALPVGISFFTFQLMSYVFDVYYNRAAVQKNPFRIALYISLFPQLIAGPIVRYQAIVDELADRRDAFLDMLDGDGMRRFVYGLGKKVLIANFMAQIADNAFAANEFQGNSAMFAWLGATAYTLQIYFDFSGYSDMAIGLGRMFGFHFPENFNYPYIAASVTDFWKRWHISLTSWFRDYVYIPLGGSRVRKARWIFNMLVVWLLTGFWHGANWTFVLWGLIHFFALLFEKTTGIAGKCNVATRLWTFLVVVLGLVFFRASDVISGWRYAESMFGVGAIGFWGNDFVSVVKRTWVVFLMAIVGATPLLAKLFQWLRARNVEWPEYAWLLAVLILSTLEVVSSTYNPFIYFNF